MIELFYDLELEELDWRLKNAAIDTVSGWLGAICRTGEFKIQSMPKVDERNTLVCWQIRIRFAGKGHRSNAMLFKLKHHNMLPLR